MFLLEGFQTGLVLGLQLFGGLDFNAHLGIADDCVDLFLVVGVPVGYLLTLVVVAFIGNDFLDHEMLKGVAVGVGAPFQGVTLLKFV